MDKRIVRSHQADLAPGGVLEADIAARGRLCLQKRGCFSTFPMFVLSLSW